MATATRVPDATRTVTKPQPAAVKPPKDVTIELDQAAAKIFADLKTARHDKADANAREKAAKAALYDVLPKQKKRERFILRAAGQVLGKVSWRAGQNQCDLDLLMQAFPEAYEACVSRGEPFKQIN